MLTRSAIWQSLVPERRTARTRQRSDRAQSLLPHIQFQPPVAVNSALEQYVLHAERRSGVIEVPFDYRRVRVCIRGISEPLAAPADRQPTRVHDELDCLAVMLKLCATPASRKRRR